MASNKFGSCPCCKGDRAACRPSKSREGDFWCHKVSGPGDTPEGWLWVAPLGNGMGSAVRPLAGYEHLHGVRGQSAGSWRSLSDAERQAKENERIARERARDEEKRKTLEKLLPVETRNEKYREILRGLTLSWQHNQKLRSRGLSGDEVEKLKELLLLRTWIPNKTVYGCEGLAGVFNNKLNYLSGFVIPAYDPRGRITGFQLASDDPTYGKYLWVSSLNKGGNGPQLPNGELPPFVWRNPASPICSEVWLCEGALKSGVTAIKLWVSDNRIQRSIVVIGTAQSASYGSETLREYLRVLNPTVVRILPDAGSIENEQIFKNNNNTACQCESWGYEVKIGWWGQQKKGESKDIDDLLIAGEGDSIAWITPSEYARMGRLTEEQSNTATSEQSESDNDNGRSVGGDGNPYNDQFARYRLWAKTNYNNNRAFTPDIELNQKYLLMPDDPEAYDWENPMDGLIYAIKASMGNGKTHLLEYLFKTIWKDRGVVCLGYRNGLLHQLTVRLEGLEHLHDRDGNGFIRRGDRSSKIAFCDASLHHFEADDFDNKILIIDEVISVLKSLMTSATCRNKRDKILKRFKDACRRSAAIMILDANLTDWACDLIATLAPDKGLLKIENIYRAHQWDVEFLLGSGEESKIKYNDDSVLKESIFFTNDPFIVMSDNQKGLEAIDRQLETLGKKGLRVDSTTSSTTECVSFLMHPDNYIRNNQPQYILCSPSAESGLDISIKGYFKNLFFLGKGVVDIDSVLQMLGRVRDDDVKRYVFVPHKSIVEDGTEFSSTVWSNIVNDIKMRFKDTWKTLLNEVENGQVFCEFLMTLFESESNHRDYYKAYGIISANFNYERWSYRETLLNRLREGGHTVKEFLSETTIGSDDAQRKFKELVSEIKDERSQKISAAPDINDATASKYRQNPNLTPDDRAKLEKYNLKRRVPNVELTPDFVRHVKFDKPQTLKECELFFMIDNPKIAAAIARSSWLYAINNFGFWLHDDRTAIALHAEILRELEIKKYIGLDIIWTKNCPEFKEFRRRWVKLRGQNRFHNLANALGIKVLAKNHYLPTVKNLMQLFRRLGCEYRRIQKGKDEFRITNRIWDEEYRILIWASFHERFKEITDPIKDFNEDLGEQCVNWMVEQLDIDPNNPELRVEENSLDPAMATA